SGLLGPTTATLAQVEHFDGRPGRARRLLADLGPAARGPFAPVAEICRTLIACDGIDDARAIVADIDRAPPRTELSVISARAAFAEHEGRPEIAVSGYEETARRWRGLGH